MDKSLAGLYSDPYIPTVMGIFVACGLLAGIFFSGVYF
jgi:hypothetical protein